jgi:truncated hemoglobin YjbI
MLGPNVIKTLAPALKANRSLRELDLTWNNLGLTRCRGILANLPYESNRVISVQLHCNGVESSAFGDVFPSAAHGVTSTCSLHSSTGQPSTPSAKTTDSRTLYEIVGGSAMLENVVGTFYLLLVTDSMIGPRFFHHVTMSRMRHLLLNYMCHLLGGTQEIESRNLLGAHKHLGINDDLFDQVLAHLGTAFVFHLSRKDIPGHVLP